MAHEVFISYAQPDKAGADRVCEILEGHGVACWIAPRDIPPGVTWANAIVHAIGDCRLMVLICSSHANESRQMPRELELADARRLPIIPVRLENTQLSGDLQYFLENTQWFDAFPGNIDDHADSLVRAIRELLLSHAKSGESTVPKSLPSHIPVAPRAPERQTLVPAAVSPAPRSRSHGKGWIIGASAAVLAIAAIVFWATRSRNSAPVSPLAPSQQAGQSLPPSSASAFAGTWVLQGQIAKQGPQKFEIEQKGLKLLIHGYGRCEPQDCDWGVQEAPLKGDSTTVVFKTGDWVREFKLKLDATGSMRVRVTWLQGGTPGKVTEHVFVKPS